MAKINFRPHNNASAKLAPGLARALAGFVADGFFVDADEVFGDAFGLLDIVRHQHGGWPIK